MWRDGGSRRARESRCRFEKAADRWILRADCVTNRSIDLPQGVALDGAGHTISLAGHAENFDSAGVRISGATVDHLTIDGSGLDASCPNYLAALVVGGPGTVADVTVSNIRFGADGDHGVGIEVAVFDGDAVVLRNVTVRNIGGTAMLLVGDGSVSVVGSAVRNATRDLQATRTITVATTGISPDGVPGATPHPRHRQHLLRS